MSTSTQKQAKPSAGVEPIAYRVPSGTAHAMGIERYQDAASFGGDKKRLHEVAEEFGWKPLCAAPVSAEPVAVLRFDCKTPGRENGMPTVVSCNWMPDGEYQVYLAPVAAQAQLESAELREARHDSAHAETESERVRALAYWLEQQTYEPDMLSNAADTLRAYLEERSQTQPLPASLVPTAPDLEYLRGAVENTALPAFLRGQIAAAVKALATQAQQPVSGADGFPWANFPAYLIDNCEGETITEEGLQRALASMLKDPKYASAQPQPSGNAGKLPQSSGNPGQLDGGQVWDDAAMYRWLCDTAIRVQAYTAGPPNWLFRPMELRGITCDAAVKAARAAAKEQS